MSKVSTRWRGCGKAGTCLGAAVEGRAWLLAIWHNELKAVSPAALIWLSLGISATATEVGSSECAGSTTCMRARTHTHEDGSVARSGRRGRRGRRAVARPHPMPPRLALFACHAGTDNCILPNVRVSLSALPFAFCSESHTLGDGLGQQQHQYQHQQHQHQHQQHQHQHQQHQQHQHHRQLQASAEALALARASVCLP
jgi:hypothetical protein